MFPKVMRAAAGPPDLGPGDRDDEAFSELAVQMGVDPDNGTASDEYSTADDLGLATGHDSDLELYHHVSSVCWSRLPIADPEFPV